MILSLVFNIMVVNLNFFSLSYTGKTGKKFRLTTIIQSLSSSCLTGVRQRENLSPFLFSIFVNDLEDFFRQLDGEPLEIIQEKLENELHIFYKFFVILYADDTVILSETKEGMQ